MRLPSSSLSCTFSCWSSGTPTQIREYGCGDLFHFKLLPIDGLVAPKHHRINGDGLAQDDPHVYPSYFISCGSLLWSSKSFIKKGFFLLFFELGHLQ